MKQKSFLNAVSALVFMFFLSGCTQNNQIDMMTESFSVTSNEQVLEEVMPILQQFLNAQYDYVIGKDIIPQWDQYLFPNSDQSSLLKSQIDEMKENNYSYNKSSFINYSSQLEKNNFTKVFLSGDVWIIDELRDHYKIVEKSEYLEEPFPKESAVFSYSFVLKKDGNEWKIRSWEENGLAGLDKNQRWFRQSLEPYNPKLLLKYQPRSSGARSLVLNHALTFINYPYSAYPNYSNVGGDCTNFVSHCLEAGGWQQTGKSSGRGSVYSWYHDRGYSSPAPTSVRSTSWTEAKSLYSFLNANFDRAVPASYPLSSYEIGDVVQLINNGLATHSMIITYSNGGIIRVHYRNGGGYPVGEDIDTRSWNSSNLKYWKIIY